MREGDGHWPCRDREIRRCRGVVWCIDDEAARRHDLLHVRGERQRRTDEREPRTRIGRVQQGGGPHAVVDAPLQRGCVKGARRGVAEADHAIRDRVFRAARWATQQAVEHDATLRAHRRHDERNVRMSDGTAKQVRELDVHGIRMPTI